VSFENAIDLKLRNDLSFPVRLAVHATAGRLTCEIRAPQAAGRTVNVAFERQAIAGSGLRVLTVRTITLDDGTESREVVALDTYH